MGTESKVEAGAQDKGDQGGKRSKPRRKPGDGGRETPTTIRKGIYLNALIYIEGDQVPAENFNALAKAALRDRLAWKHDPEHDKLVMTLKKAEEQTDVEADEGSDEEDKPDGGTEEKFEF